MAASYDTNIRRSAAAGNLIEDSIATSERKRPTIQTAPTLSAPTVERPLVEGLVVGGTRGFYEVKLPEGSLVCTIRGRLRKDLVYSESKTGFRSVHKVNVQQHDPVVVGDRVRALPSGDGSGVIVEILERANGSFTRQDPAGENRTLTTVAGLDQLVCVFAARRPEPHLRLLDRLLVLAELQQLAAIVCINKVDLEIAPRLDARLAVYAEAGYPVLLTSVVQARGIEALRSHLAGHTSVLLGPSGVGKTSLLNALQPGLGERTGSISDATNKGRHTTTGTRLYPLEGVTGYLADTAGIRGLALAGDVVDRLAACFPEFRQFLSDCRHTDCSHIHEPGCAVREAVRDGRVDAQRYDSFCRLHEDGAPAIAAALTDVE